MTRFAIIFLFISLLSVISFPQENQTPVALINNQSITSEEFKLRFELSPYISRKYDSSQIDSLKMDFLYSLIAEKIWALEAKQIGLDQTERFRFIFQPVEAIILRDALFKKEIESKIFLTPEDITNGIQKFNTTISTEIIASEDSALINKIYNELLNSSNPDSLIKNSSINKLSTEKEITLGTLNNESLEDSIYSLSPLEFTEPFRHESAWVIFFVSNKITGSADLTDLKIVNEIQRTIKNRRIQKKYNEYLKELLSEKTFSINEEAFFYIGDIITNVILSKPGNKENIFFLNEGDYFSILNQLNDENLNKELFTTGIEPFTIFDLLSSLSFDQFSIKSQNKNEILGKLNNQIKIYIEQDVLTNEALIKGLIQLPEVKNDLEMWRENYLSNMYRVSFYDSIKVSGDEIYDYYLKKIESEGVKLINLALITTDDLNVIANILEQLESGKEFNEIASEIGKTDPLVNEDGKTGLTPAVMLGSLGKIAEDLKLNEIYGPLKRGISYSVFQVLEKQTSNDTLKLAFESAKPGLRGELINEKITELLTGKTVNFIYENRVKVFPEVINKIKVSGIQMFVHRLMGFGGKIAGVPVTTPFSDWIKEIGSNKLLP